MKHLSVEQACSQKQFFCSLESNVIHLRKDHPYYHQVQGAMAITGIHVTDFVVWTPVSMKVQEINFDTYLWDVVMSPKLKEFYKNYMLPAILY